MNKLSLHLVLVSVSIFCTSTVYCAESSRPSKYDRDREHPIVHQLASLVLDDQVDAMGVSTAVHSDALRTFIVQKIQTTNETFKRYEKDLSEQKKHIAHQNALTQALKLRPHAHNISTLRLQNLKLTTFASEIFELTNLEWLDMADNKLTAVPEEICKLRNLEVLVLSGNMLSELPSTIELLTRLRTFSAEKNHFTTMPHEIFQLRNLTFLGLNANKISVIPAAIRTLTQLEFLCLRLNELETLPPELFDLTKLRHLELAYNQKIKELPEAVGQLTALQYLDICGNQFTALPLKALAQLGKKRSQSEKGLQTHAYDNPFSQEYLAEVKQLVMATGAYITCCYQHISDFDHIIYDGMVA